MALTIEIKYPRVPGPVLRYPETMGSTSGSPFVMFSRHRAVYADAANNGIAASQKNIKGLVSGTVDDGGIQMIEAGKVAMYVPMGIAFGDNMMYDTVGTGALGTLISNTGDLIDSDSISEALDKASAQLNSFTNDITAAGRSSGGIAAGTAAAGVAKSLKGTGFVKTLLAGSAVGLGTNVAMQEASKSWQTGINPREFLLFKAPSMRAFSLSFRFIPSSLKESESVVDIIKFFREGMYPEVSSSGFAYNFPDAFSLEFNNVEGVPLLPEMYLESATTTYNPNSMSYYKHGNRPVEVLLSLSFKEIQPLNRQLVKAGF